MLYYVDFWNIRQISQSLRRDGRRYYCLRVILWHLKITFPHYLKKKVRQIFEFGTPYICYTTKNLINLISTVEDIMPGQYNFNAIILTNQNHFSALLQNIFEKKNQIRDTLFNIWKQRVKPPSLWKSTENFNFNISFFSSVFCQVEVINQYRGLD